MMPLGCVGDCQLSRSENASTSDTCGVDMSAGPQQYNDNIYMLVSCIQ